MNTPLIVGNWKMELSYQASLEVTKALKKRFKSTNGVDIVLCPSFTTLAAVASEIGASTKLALGAQNVHWEEKGAFTGEVSISQLTPLVKWCIIGHSERRQLVRETDEQVNIKAQLLLKHGITPIVCIGETAAEHEAGQTIAKITAQAGSLLDSISRSSLTKLVIAYEPIWAIGTGVTPEPNSAASTMLLIRKLAAERFGHDTAERMRILYGGSVKGDNAASFFSEPGIDGALVGGASVSPLQFADIVEAAAQAK